MFGKGYRVEIYQKAFESTTQLYQTMGHEYIEVGLHYRGFAGTWANHYAASKWEDNQGSLIGKQEVAKYTHGTRQSILSKGMERFEILKNNNYFGIPKDIPINL